MTLLDSPSCLKLIHSLSSRDLRFHNDGGLDGLTRSVVLTRALCLCSPCFVQRDVYPLSCMVRTGILRCKGAACYETSLCYA